MQKKNDHSIGFIHIKLQSQYSSLHFVKVTVMTLSLAGWKKKDRQFMNNEDKPEEESD